MVFAIARRCASPPACNTPSSKAWSAGSIIGTSRASLLGERCADLLEHVLRAHRDRRARSVDALDAGVVQELVVLLRDHAADEHDDVVGALFLQLLDDR